MSPSRSGASRCRVRELPRLAHPGGEVYGGAQQAVRAAMTYLVIEACGAVGRTVQ
jgi:hypothetical protein